MTPTRKPTVDNLNFDHWCNVRSLAMSMLTSMHVKAFRNMDPLWGESTRHQWIHHVKGLHFEPVMLAFLVSRKRWSTAQVLVISDAGGGGGGGGGGGQVLSLQ